MSIKAFAFIKEVRQEVKKISWSGRKDILVSTVIVMTIAALASLFFLLVDSVIYKITKFILGFGG